MTPEDLVSAYRMPKALAHLPTFFPFGIQRQPYKHASGEGTNLVHGWSVGWTMTKSIRQFPLKIKYVKMHIVGLLNINNVNKWVWVFQFSEVESLSTPILKSKITNGRTLFIFRHKHF